jgi:hypothetical protein
MDEGVPPAWQWAKLATSPRRTAPYRGFCGEERGLCKPRLSEERGRWTWIKINPLEIPYETPMEDLNLYGYGLFVG